MINKRLIPVIILKNGLVVQSFNFQKYLPIGKPEYIVRYLSTWECDELIILDIDASNNNSLINTDLIKFLSKNVSIPLTIGGGVNSIQSAEVYFKNGADKISINSLFLDAQFSTINSISEEYGSQSIVLSIDFIQIEDGTYYLYDYKKKGKTKIDIFKVFDLIENQLQVGEVLINSVNRDGSKLGYDIELYKLANDFVNHPILSLGGANRHEHFIEILQLNKITGMCAGNIFLHTEHSVEIFRSKINKVQNILRPNNYFSYE